MQTPTPLPSRTYTLGMTAMVVLLIIAAALLVLIGYHPDQAAHLSQPLGLCCMGIGGAGAMTGAGMSLRDYGSGGLTSSSAPAVLAAMRAGYLPPGLQRRAAAPPDPEPSPPAEES